MNELARTALSVLLTPVTFALAVFTAYYLKDWIRDIVRTTGLTELGVTKEGGLSAKFNPEVFAKEAYQKQGMGVPSHDDVREIATLVDTLRPYLAGRRILWVDNHPENNQLERAALTSWGADVQARRSTEEAINELSDRADAPFDLVISDWFRNRQPEGHRLAEMMNSKGIDVPIVFYFSVDADPVLFSTIQHQAQELGAVGATSSPRELLRWIFAELVRAALRDDRTTIGV